MASSRTLADFRSQALEHLARVEVAWSAVQAGGTIADRVADEAFAALNTVHLEARALSLTDVSVLARRVSDLLALARARGYKVSHDADIVLTMGLQFIGVLLRRKAGAAMGGVDLVGFLRQLDEITRLERDRPAGAAPGATIAGTTAPGTPVRESAGLRPPPRAREPSTAAQKLAWLATQVFVEHLRAAAATRARLHDLWTAFAREVAELPGGIGARRPELEVHAFESARTGVILCVPAEYAVTALGRPPPAARDPLELLGGCAPTDRAGAVRGVRVVGDGLDVTYAVGGAVNRRFARRLAPTGFDDPAEVVEVQGVEALLLHLDALERRNPRGPALQGSGA